MMREVETKVGTVGRTISSTPSDNVHMIEGQDQETVVGSGTHLDGVVVKTRTKVKYINVSETVDVLVSQILDCGLVKTHRGGDLQGNKGISKYSRNPMFPIYLL